MLACGILTFLGVLRNDRFVQPDVIGPNTVGSQVAPVRGSKLTNPVGSDKEGFEGKMGSDPLGSFLVW
jgi:hypothetical protein